MQINELERTVLNTINFHHGFFMYSRVISYDYPKNLLNYIVLQFLN